MKTLGSKSATNQFLVRKTTAFIKRRILSQILIISVSMAIIVTVNTISIIGIVISELVKSSVSQQWLQYGSWLGLCSCY